MMAQHTECCKSLFKVMTIICQNELLDKVEGESIAIMKPNVQWHFKEFT